MEWKSDIATALAVMAAGWSTEEQRAVYNAAHVFVLNVAREAHFQAVKDSTCRTCGHNPLSAADRSEGK